MPGLRDLPSIERLLQSSQAVEMTACFGRPLTLQALRQTLDQIRSSYEAGQNIPDQVALLEMTQHLLSTWTAPTLLPVINATGVILHTNLGRAPLSQAALQAVAQAARGYSNLEYDLEKGKRGSRLVHAETLLQRLTGAQAALVVNNNAAAVMLVLSALARRRSVVIARSQLVEIGGGFRVPDVMKQSGARLLEVGTTNRVHVRDYEEALQEKPALFMQAHRSNFQLVGFTSEPELSEIVAVAHQASIPVVDDLGSGTFLDTARFGLAHEPMVQESLASGVDLVCFSGDKLLGGPQAGIVVGRADLVQRLRKHPLARAIRADKLCLSALTATLLHYLKDEAEREIPVWRMLSMPIGEVRLRAETWLARLGEGRVIGSESTIGGGSLPGETLPTWVLALEVRNPNQVLERLRRENPAIIARAQDDRVLLDPRTVLNEQEELLLDSLQRVLKSSNAVGRKL
jgi:L-seryl-tRNA(Ser) seleniumtransferase